MLITRVLQLQRQQQLPLIWFCGLLIEYLSTAKLYLIKQQTKRKEWGLRNNYICMA